MPRTQSTYCHHHSTETALLKVFSNIATAVDCGRVKALCMLNLLGAFDTVEHSILLERLEKTFGFTDKTNKWLRSYLENQVFRDYFATHFSSPVVLRCGVPHGSVLGPLLFTIYTAELSLKDMVAIYTCTLMTTRSMCSAVMLTP